MITGLLATTLLYKSESKMLFSLILATYGRSVELGRMFESLMKQDVGLDKFEVIVIDQNDKIDLSEIIESYSGVLKIKHVKSSRKGLSLNRNIGLKYARGAYVCFPDDDCTYYPDTLSTVYRHFCEGKAFAIFGAIRDRGNGQNIIRDWPWQNKKITRLNFFFLCSSITVFARKSELRFDESLGAGRYFGACEDTDYVYSLISTRGDCHYFEDVEVWHPPVGIEEFTKEKSYSYGLGFGAFCAKYKSDPFVLRVFFMSLGYHVALSILSLLRLNIDSARLRREATMSRVRGFFEYLKREN